MFSKEEMDAMAQRAKEQLGSAPDEDLYADFRDESEEVGTASKAYNKGDIQHTASDYQDNPAIDSDINNALDYEGYSASIEEGDYRIFDNGPLLSEINSWKKQWEGSLIFVADVCGITFVFRTLNRFEYKQIVALPNVDGLQREEIICETVVLFPQQYSWKEMATQYAGVPSTLAEIVMSKSGFTKEYSIQVL